MEVFHCAFCHEGPYEQDEIIRVKTTKDEFTLCGQGKCVKRMFAEHDPATFHPQAAICGSCENHPVVVTITNRGARPFSVCSRCMIGLFFDSSTVS